MVEDSETPVNASVTPYLAVKGASEAITFYQAAFGAVEVFRLNGEDGRVSQLRSGSAGRR